VAKLTRLTKDAGLLLAPLLPSGPAWDALQPFLRAVLSGANGAVLAAYNRVLDLLKEADPRTAVETLPEWLEAWGLAGGGGAPPASEEGQRGLLVGKVTAQGGQARAYYRQVVRTILGDDEAEVIITERPYGQVFSAWVSNAWEPLVSTRHMHHWWVTVPIAPSDPKWAAIEAVLDMTKPAHTVVTVVDGT